MLFAVDAMKLSQPLDGVGNFLFNAIVALAKNTDYSFLLFTHSPFPRDVQNELNKYGNVTTIVSHPPILQRNGMTWMFLTLPRLISMYKPDYFWAPAVLFPPIMPKHTKVIATVHDFVYIDYPETMGWKNHLMNQLLFKRSIRNADILWSVSEYTKERIKKFFSKEKYDREREIFVGSSISFDKLSCCVTSTEMRTRLKGRYNINKPYILFVGTIEPRKNLSFLLRLFPLLDSDINLVIVGSKGWQKSSVISDIVNSEGYPKDRVIFTGYIPDVDLTLFYRGAKAFVSCSLNEGFGLPQLEAIYCDCPVVCPNNSAMTEVVTGCGTLVDGWDMETWANTIGHILNNRPYYGEARKEKLKFYDWASIAKRFFSFIEKS